MVAEWSVACIHFEDGGDILLRCVDHVGAHHIVAQQADIAQEFERPQRYCAFT